MRDAVDFVSYFSAAINTRETEMEQIIHIRGQSVWLTVLSLFRMTKATRKLYAFCCHLRPNFVDIVIRHDALCVHRKMSIKMKIKATAPPLDDFSRNRAQFRTPKIIETSILPATADIGETSYSTWIIISMSFAVNGMRFQIASSFKHRRFSISLIMTFCFFLSTAQNQFHTASASQREQEYKNYIHKEHTLDWCHTVAALVSTTRTSLVGSHNLARVRVYWINYYSFYSPFAYSIWNSVIHSRTRLRVISKTVTWPFIARCLHCCNCTGARANRLWEVGLIDGTAPICPRAYQPNSTGTHRLGRRLPARVIAAMRRVIKRKTHSMDTFTN